MESEDITKLVDGVYKNILEKFNPGARQLITAGKGYLKSLHGAAAAARLFNETLSKIALNAQHSGTNDIGVALLNVVSVYKEIQEQQMNILKAFYVDLLVPLETNLEKDTKVVQHEQKKFMQQHKVRLDSYQKAVATMKKQQRKKKASPENTDKELRLLEEQKRKLDLFCEQSYRNAMQQERRRYGFVLERQCSIAKHWMAYHTTGKSILVNNIENWQDVANSREFLPPLLHNNNSNNSNNDNNGATLTQQIVNKRLERFKDIDIDMQQQQQQQQQHGLTNTNSNQLKKSRSIDATYGGDMRSMHELNTFNHNHQPQNSLPRAKSDFNINNTTALQQSAALYDNDDPDNGHWDQRYVVKALYTYMPSGENQLMLEEGDRIALVGGKAKGWQFGENLRTQMFGWFPISYTNSEFIHDNKSIKSERENNSERSRNRSYDQMQYEQHEHNAIPMRSSYPEQIYHNNREMQQRNTNNNHNHNHNNQHYQNRNYHQDMDNGMESDTTYRRDRTEETSPTRMFGDTYRQQKKYRPITNEHPGNPRPGPPPTLPAPVPLIQNSNRTLNSSQSFCASNGASSAIERRKQKLQNTGGGQAYNQHTSMNEIKGAVSNGPTTAAKTSLHSSNDSGFANEPPPQPEVDYSDDDQPGNRVPIRRRTETDARNMASTRELSINSWSLNRNFRKSVESHTPENDKNFQNIIRGTKSYDLIASDDELLQGGAAGLKRTKSFWKFGGVRNNDNDILAGMSMWQHRDLVATPNVEENRDEGYRTTSSKMESEREIDNNNDTLTKSNSLHFTRPNQDKSLSLRKDSITSLEMYDEDENIYGIGPMIRETPPQITQIKNSTGYTPKSRMKIMKTIEIDIENPTDNTEKLNTIKRGHNGYRESTTVQHHQQHHQPHQQQLQQQHQQKYQQPYYNQGFNNRNTVVMESKGHTTIPANSRGGNSNSHYKKSYESKNQQINKHNPSNSSRTLKSDEACASTESEANESELDNGTLKMSDVNNFFDTNTNEGGGGVGIIMKTVKRKDILKQYYSSEDESEDHDIKSTSSDPYDCIVINDHLVRGGDKQKGRNTMQMQEHQMEFQTFRASATTSSTTTTHNAHTNAKHNQKHHNNNNHNSEPNINDGPIMEKHRSPNRKSNYPNVIEQERYMNSHSSNATRHSNNAITMNTPTATILPRTRLMKSSASMTLERSSTINSGQKSRSKLMSSSNSIMGDKQQQQQQQQQLQQQHYNKTYGPWYDFWDQQDDVMERTPPHQHHQKNSNNNNNNNNNNV